MTLATRPRHLAGAAALLVLGGCSSHRPPETDVSVEETRRITIAPADRARVDWADRTFPPLYFDEILPEYPEVAIEHGVPELHVAVAFVVAKDGRPRDVEAEALEEHPVGDAFVAAAERAVGEWRFSPAWRLARTPAGGGEDIVALDYTTRLVFRFALERAEGDVRVDSFD